MGPNVRRLVAHKVSLNAVPKGGGLADAVRFLSNPSELLAKTRAAQEWVREAIAVVKSSPDNPYGDDDEVIAGEILRRIEAIRSARKPPEGGA